MTKNANNQYLISDYKIRKTDQQNVGQSMQIKAFVLSSEMIPFYGSFIKIIFLKQTKQLHEIRTLPENLAYISSVHI